MFYYHAHGFEVQSEIALPSDGNLRGAPKAVALPLKITKRTLDQSSCLLSRYRPRHAYDVGDGIFAPWQGLKFHIAYNGSGIGVDVKPELEIVAAKWLLNHGIGACVLLNDGLPLHGAAVEINGNFIALIAASGTGKSTLVRALIERSVRFGSDDLTATYFRAEGIFVEPSLSLYPKLHDEAIKALGLSTEGSVEAIAGSNEFWMPINTRQRVLEAKPLTAIISLEPQTGATCEPHFQAMPDDACVPFLMANTHSAGAIHPFLNVPRIQEQYSKLLSTAPILQLVYARGFDALPDVCDFLIRSFPAR